jgi:hypothetical protein
MSPNPRENAYLKLSAVGEAQFYGINVLPYCLFCDIIFVFLEHQMEFLACNIPLSWQRLRRIECQIQAAAKFRKPMEILHAL